MLERAYRSRAERASIFAYQVFHHRVAGGFGLLENLKGEPVILIAPRPS
jgi:hypothetical protein